MTYYEGLLYVKKQILMMQDLLKEEMALKEKLNRRHIDFQKLLPKFSEQKNRKKRIYFISIIVVLLNIVITYIMLSDHYLENNIEVSPITFLVQLIQHIFILSPAGFREWLIIFICMRIYFYYKDKAIDRKNKIIQQKNEEASYMNLQLDIENRRVREKLEAVQRKQELISEEYSRYAAEWYPREYGYLEAVNFFINLFENHLADNIKEAVATYKEHLYREEMLNIEYEKNDRIEVMISNQTAMIRMNDEIIRQQMLGNFLNAANLMSRW